MNSGTNSGMNQGNDDLSSDDVLILYYYGDGLTDVQREAIADDLAKSPDLAQRYETLARDLDAIRDPADLRMPDGLEYRLQSALQRAARLESDREPDARGWLQRWSLGAGIGVAAVLALGIGIGVWWSSGGGPMNPPGPQPQSGPPVEWSSAAFERGLESHFRSGRSELAAFSGGGHGDRAALVASLIEQNRFYARLATQNDAPELARVLRSFEPVLQRLGQEDLPADDAAALQAQLEFEFTVMLTKLARSSSQKANPDNLEMSL